MLDFEHERSIKFSCHLKKEEWQLGSVKIDSEVKALFKRCGFSFTKNKKLNPHIILGKILGFLGEKRLDSGGVFLKLSDTKYTAEIHVKKRPQYSHSG